jgi:hypothetical protein
VILVVIAFSSLLAITTCPHEIMRAKRAKKIPNYEPILLAAHIPLPSVCHNPFLRPIEKEK